jgi:hypothetical protein
MNNNLQIILDPDQINLQMGKGRQVFVLWRADGPRSFDKGISRTMTYIDNASSAMMHSSGRQGKLFVIISVVGKLIISAFPPARVDVIGGEALMPGIGL